MKIHKKILFWFSAASIFFLALAALYPKPAAAAFDDKSIQDHWKVCVDSVLYDQKYENRCALNKTGQSKIVYAGSSEYGWRDQVTYKVVYPSDGSAPPKNIDLVNSSNSQPLVPIAGPKDVHWNKLTYANYSDTIASVSSHDDRFYVYKPGEQVPNNEDYAFLASINQDRTLRILALVYNKIVPNKGVIAEQINLTATASTPTGGECKPGDTSPACTPPPPGGGGSVTGTNAACYTWEWSWAACPIITVAQTTANGMYGFVEDQLKFTVSEDGTQKDSLGDQDTRESVRAAWNNFRILVSGLVVILLLVMVISQAIGTGPFDAYTAKKMLPRLVMGVILIQVSWPVFAWVVNTVDGLGRGLADLIYAPFGGSDALNLNVVMEPFIGGTAEVFNWMSFLGLAIGAVVAPFLMLGIMLAVLIAIFAGFLTLLLRKIIIILALILVPLALISWMMPSEGLRRYWKLWWENFIKALMMFPLIITIIAAGRIFAKIGSTQADFVGFFIVLVGFFGPLFILPKTFKWGGQAMQVAGGAYNKITSKSGSMSKDFLRNPEKAVGGWWARRQGLHASEYTDQDPFRKRVVTSLKAGRVIPTRRAKAAMIFRGNEFKSKENELEKAIQERRREKEASRTDNVMAGKQMDVDAITEGAAKAADAKKRGLLGVQKSAERQAKEAMRDLIATGSTLELNRVRVIDTDGREKFVWQTKMWRDLLNGSPDLYRQVKGDAPDWVPHRTPVGLPKYRGELSDEDKRTAEERGMSEDAFYQSKYRLTPEQHQILKENEDVQWASSLHETVTELDAGNLATLHPTYYERIGDAARKGQENLDQAARLRESGGDAAEVARLEEIGTRLQAPAKEFGAFIKRLSGDASGRQYLARAMGGADTMEHLDAALQYSGVEGANSAPGDNWKEGTKGHGSMENIYEIGKQQEAAMMRGEGGGIGGGGGTPPAGPRTPPPPGFREITTEDGSTIYIPHDRS